MTLLGKHIARAFFLLVLIECSYCISNAQCWGYPPIGQVMYGSLHGISFGDSSRGVTVGDYGAILFTTDGGQQWLNRSLPGLPSTYFRDVSFAGPNVVIAVAFLGEIYRSTNGGDVWQLQFHYDSLQFYAVSFYDSSRGIIVGAQQYYPGSYLVMVTSDGGFIWNTQLFNSLPPYTGFLDVEFVDSSTIVIVGNGGLIYRTSDSGNSWSIRNSGISESLTSVSFPNNRVGFAVGYGGRILQTLNGGIDWEIQNGPVWPSLASVSFADSNNGIIFGQEGTVLTTSDGGIHWSCDTLDFGNRTYIRDVTYRHLNNIIAVGVQRYCVIIERNDTYCSPLERSPIYPEDGAVSLVLNQSVTTPQSLTLEWNFFQQISATHTHIQVSTDSNFSDRNLVDSSIALSPIIKQMSLLVTQLLPHTTYHWRASIQYADGSESDWSETWSFTTAGGVVRGMIFDDLNRDGAKQESEPGLPNWPISVSGKLQLSLWSDAQGEFNLVGIDSGYYRIANNPYYPYSSSIPDSNSYLIDLGYNEEITGLNFGRYIPWNSISGIVFEDKNENGIKDDYESGLTNWLVRLTGNKTDSVLTDQNGSYTFGRLSYGTYMVNAATQLGWEQIYPHQENRYTHIFYSYGHENTGSNFSVHLIPTRIKLTMTVRDNTSVHRKEIRWGVRPGTTFGIWGVDPFATRYDFSEGEYEVPPLYYGLFDGRFINPRFTSDQFGAGSWTDMRNFYSQTQVDSHAILFQPGYISGGDYPMSFYWTKEEVQSSFKGPVRLVDGGGTITDMKLTDSLIITNPDIWYLYLIAERPNLPLSIVTRWWLISLPVQPSDNRVQTLFHSAISPAYSFTPVVGYRQADSLVPGVGYWLKYSTSADSLSLQGNPRTSDTISVAEGWNLIGSLSSPIDVQAVESVPPGILASGFYGYDRGYFLADSLKPMNGYWVQVSQSGEIILNVSQAFSMAKSKAPVTASWLDEHVNRIVVNDAGGGEQTLYFSDARAMNDRHRAFFDLPPPPPMGTLDVRFASNRMLEVVKDGETEEFPMIISSIEYPVSISWDIQLLLVTAWLIVGGKEIALQNNGSLQIPTAGTPVQLKLKGLPGFPKEFSLEQNYPNPFNPTTRILFDVPEQARVTLKVFNLLGQEIVTVLDGLRQPGSYSVQFDGSSLPSGVYMYRVEAVNMNQPEKTFRQVRKMVLIK